jgi:hypothetical protein
MAADSGAPMLTGGSDVGHHRYYFNLFFKKIKL